MGLAGFIAGCGGGAVAPVHSLGEPETTAREPGRERKRGYLVARGDTVYSIAWRHGVDYRELARFNSIRDPFTIHPGQRLRIPGPGDVVAPASEMGAAVAEPAGPAVVSTRGTGAQDAPLPKPVPLPAPSSIAKAIPPAPAKVPGLPAKPVPVPASKAPAKPQRRAEPETAASTPSAEPPLATRVAAGLSWTRPTRGKAVGTFGRGGNKGVDVAGEFEQPIRAASRGRVVYAGSGLVGYGKLVIVKHNSRLLSAYAHNERLRVKEGDDVKSGQHIADMGRSAKGRTMLHFEIRRDGKPVDPLRYLP